MTGTVITLHIDTLAFPGLEAGDARRAARAFETELTSLLQRYGLAEDRGLQDFAQNLVRDNLARAIGCVDLGNLAIPFGTPEAMGRAVARALFDRVTA